MNRVLILLFAFCLLAAIAYPAIAEEVPTPTEAPEGVKIIQAPEAKDMIGLKDIHIFDMRKALNYGKGHLPGAVSLPYNWTKKGHPSERTGEFEMERLPVDKNARIIFHSDGPNGWKSYYASRAAAEAGYTNVMWMRDGFAVWEEKGYPIEY